ncbi:MAG: hypothetical protein ACRETQ_05495 [Gammaproteobacteria bacterium]
MTDTPQRQFFSDPFLITGGLAIIVGGLVAAAVAHQPTQHLVWMAAYLVLIVGVAQMVFGGGQAWLSADTLRPAWRASEWIIYNLGNAGVIAGTLADLPSLVVVGTVLFIIGVALFLVHTRARTHIRWLIGYRILLGLVFLTSLVGLVLTFVGQLR